MLLYSLPPRSITTDAALLRRVKNHLLQNLKRRALEMNWGYQTSKHNMQKSNRLRLLQDHNDLQKRLGPLY